MASEPSHVAGTLGTRFRPTPGLHEHASVCIVMHMTRQRVAVAGASGYAGGEVLRLLLGHPDVEIGALTGGVQRRGAARRAAAAPACPLADRVLEPTTLETLAGHDVVVPRPAARPVRRDRRPARRRHRRHRLRRRLPARPTPPPGSGSTAATHAGSWPYGLPELPGQREQLRGATRIAVPGCYPTVSTLALAPAVAAGLVEPDVVVVAASGTSGAGKAAKPHLLGSEVMGNASAYGVGGAHRHTPEITQNLARRRRRRRRRQLHPDAGPDVARHPRHLLGPAAPAA